MGSDDVVQVLEPRENLVNRIAAVVALQKVENRFQLPAHSYSLLESTEEGPQGGSVSVASAIGVAPIIHVFPTPRGP